MFPTVSICKGCWDWPSSNQDLFITGDGRRRSRWHYSVKSFRRPFNHAANCCRSSRVSVCVFVVCGPTDIVSSIRPPAACSTPILQPPHRRRKLPCRHRVSPSRLGVSEAAHPSTLVDSTNIAARYSYYPLQETALRITFRPAVALSEWQTTDSSNYF